MSILSSALQVEGIGTISAEFPVSELSHFHAGLTFAAATDGARGSRSLLGCGRFEMFGTRNSAEIDVYFEVRSNA